jgi:hypothetical protein
VIEVEVVSVFTRTGLPVERARAEAAAMAGASAVPPSRSGTSGLVGWSGSGADGSVALAWVMFRGAVT